MVAKTWILILFMCVPSSTPCPYLYTEEEDVPFKARPIVAASQNMDEEDLFTFRLPTSVKPIRYELTLETLFNDVNVVGRVVIDIHVLENVSNITLHKSDVNVISESVTVKHASSGVHVKVLSVSYEYYEEFFVIRLASELIADEDYILTIGEFVSIMSKDFTGVFMGRYEEYQHDKFFAVTQFETRYARKVFPCFDEPAFRAKFQINIIRPKTYSSISNEQLMETIALEGNKYMDKFYETIPMPTYVVAFVVGDFPYRPVDNYRFYTRREMIWEGRGNYALWKAIDFTRFMEKYLNVSYPLSKLDQVAIPNEFFWAGGMENFGLIIYRESSVLYRSSEMQVPETELVTKIIIHEVAHQWFGNLVTIAWWSYTWLKEGLATYFEYIALSELERTWGMEIRFVTDVLQVALNADSGQSESGSVTQPLTYADVWGDGPSPIVTYKKGASVIRMIDHFVSQEVFKYGLYLYVTKMQFDAATPSDLYDSLQESLEIHNKTHLLQNRTVHSIMESWENFRGYPVVVASRNYTSGKLTLSQSQFLGDAFHFGTDQIIWHIPINVANQNQCNFSDTTADIWFTSKREIFESPPTSGWIILNKQATGFYRVDYDIHNWVMIMEFLDTDNFHKIHVANRAQLIDDAFSFARAGRIPYSIPLELSRYLKRETEYLPWQSFFKAIEFLDRMLLAEDEYINFQAYVRDLLKPSYGRLGPKGNFNETHVDSLHRANIVKWMCRMSDYKCMKRAGDELSLWSRKLMTNGGENIQSEFLCAALKQATASRWSFVYYQFLMLDEKQVYEKYRLIEALACTEDEYSMDRFLAKATEKKFPEKYRRAMFKAAAGSTKWGLELFFNYVEKNFETVKKSLNLANILHLIAEHFTTRRQLIGLRLLMAEHKKDRRSFHWALEEAEKNVRWTTYHLPHIKKWLASDDDDVKSTISIERVLMYTVLPASVFSLARYFYLRP